MLPSWAHGGSWPILGEAKLDFSDGKELDLLKIPLVEGMITGSLRDQDGLPISGALLVLRSLGSDQLPRTAARVWPPVRSEDDGSFTLVDLPPGTYEVELVAGEAREKQQVQVRAGSLGVVDFGLVSPRSERSK